MTELEALWQHVTDGVEAEAAFLRELSCQRVFVILRQPPGHGAAAPEYNLVQWRRESDSTAFVPVFTSKTHLVLALPSPAQHAQVPMRVLLAVCGDQRYIINPLSKTPFELGKSHLALSRAYIVESCHDAEWPSRSAPWIFRLPDDALYSVALKWVQWFNATGRVDQAFLYELTRGTRGNDRRTELVLGLNEPADRALAETLTMIATQEGVDTGSFVVRFLPDEPAHREGIAQAGLSPFYQRPTSTRW